MKNILLLSILLLSYSGIAQTGQLRGITSDIATNRPVPFTNVTLHSSDGVKLIFAAQTNFDGIYSFSELPQGEYVLKFNAMQYGEVILSGVIVQEGKMTIQKAQLLMLTQVKGQD